MTWPGIDTDFISDEHSELVNRPVTESVTARDGSDTDFPSSEHSEFVDRLNMSISTADTEAEQNGRPTNCSPTGRRGSDTRVPPNTEEDEDIICPWMDCLLNGEFD